MRANSKLLYVLIDVVLQLVWWMEYCHMIILSFKFGTGEFQANLVGYYRFWFVAVKTGMSPAEITQIYL